MIKLKGKAIVGQSGGCTAVINQSIAGVYEAAKASKEITHLWGTRFGVNGLLRGDVVDLKRQPKSLMDKIAQLPAAALGSSRHRLAKGQEYEVLQNLRRWDVRYLFMVGGNDTAETVLRVSQAAKQANYEMRVVHIPKTIDNDLAETDHCPGYGSVARFAAIATQEAGQDTKSMRHVDPVKICEFMGRNSGWLTASSGLLRKEESDPPHLIIIPEVPFQRGHFLKQVDQILTKVGYCVIAISETIRDTQGKLLGEREEGITQDSFGHHYVEGAAMYLAGLVEKNLHVRSRFNKPGTFQRMCMGYVSTVDQREAFLAGSYAVKWATKGTSEVMVGFKRMPGKSYRIRYVPVALSKIPAQERYMPASYLNKNKTMITQSFVKYALSLLGPNLPTFPSFKNIVPRL